MPMSAVAAVCAVRGWSRLDGVRESAVSKRIGKIRDFWLMSRRKIAQIAVACVARICRATRQSGRPGGIGEASQSPTPRFLAAHSSANRSQRSRQPQTGKGRVPSCRARSDGSRADER